MSSCLALCSLVLTRSLIVALHQHSWTTTECLHSTYAGVSSVIDSPSEAIRHDLDILAFFHFNVFTSCGCHVGVSNLVHGKNIGRFALYTTRAAYSFGFCYSYQSRARKQATTKAYKEVPQASKFTQPRSK